MVVLLSGILLCLAVQPVKAVELKKECAAEFEKYIAATEARNKVQLDKGPFLFIDDLPEAQQVESYARLRKGEILVKQANTRDEARPVEVEHGLIHDWIGVIYIPNASLSQTLAVVQDYDNYQNIYKPDVRRSKLLNRNGDSFTVFLQLYKKSLVTVVINAKFDVHYERSGEHRATSRSHSTRLAEVQDFGQANEHEFPVDGGHGYAWRIYDYWRFIEKDDGVYVQFESIVLTRTVPAIFGWLINPLVRNIPRGILTNLLGATRAAVTNARPRSGAFLPTGRQ